MPFLFLSKLLPLLLYPLGCSCLLLTIALILLNQKTHLPHAQRTAKGCIGAALILLWFSSTPLGAKIVLGSLEQEFVTSGVIESMPTADAIVVLGGATLGASGARTYTELNDAGDRLVQAVRLYRAGKAEYMVLSGGRIQWNRDASDPASFTLSEAEDMQQLLELFGIPQRSLILEPDSLNTYQNAINTKVILDQENFKRILLVTSAFHLPRAIAIFKKLGIEVIPAPTDYRVIPEPGTESLSLQQFLLDLLPSAEHLRQTSIGLKEYLGLWVYRWRGWA